MSGSGIDGTLIWKGDGIFIIELPLLKVTDFFVGFVFVVLVVLNFRLLVVGLFVLPPNDDTEKGLPIFGVIFWDSPVVKSLAKVKGAAVDVVPTILYSLL